MFLKDQRVISIMLEQAAVSHASEIKPSQLGFIQTPFASRQTQTQYNPILLIPHQVLFQLNV